MTELNLDKLLSVNLDDIKRPPALPEGPYFATLETYEFTRHRNFASKIEPGEKEAVCRFRVRLNEPHEDLVELIPDGVVAKDKIFSLDVTMEDGLWKLKGVLNGLGFTGMSVTQALAETAMLPVVAHIRKFISKTSGEEMNDIKSLSPKA